MQPSASISAAIPPGYARASDLPGNQPQRRFQQSAQQCGTVRPQIQGQPLNNNNPFSPSQPRRAPLSYSDPADRLLIHQLINPYVAQQQHEPRTVVRAIADVLRSDREVQERAEAERQGTMTEHSSREQTRASEEARQLQEVQAERRAEAAASIAARLGGRAAVLRHRRENERQLADGYRRRTREEAEQWSRAQNRVERSTVDDSTIGGAARVDRGGSTPGSLLTIQTIPRPRQPQSVRPYVSDQRSGSSAVRGSGQPTQVLHSGRNAAGHESPGVMSAAVYHHPTSDYYSRPRQLQTARQQNQSARPGIVNNRSRAVSALDGRGSNPQPGAQTWGPPAQTPQQSVEENSRSPSAECIDRPPTGCGRTGR